MVSASLNSGKEKAAKLAKAALDVEAVRSTPGTTYAPIGELEYGTRQATGKITEKNPLIRLKAEMQHDSASLTPGVASSAAEARSNQPDEGACQIIELLEVQRVLHVEARRGSTTSLGSTLVWCTWRST